MRSAIKFLNAQSIVPIIIHRQLCQIYGHRRLDGQHISCRNSAGRCLIHIQPIAQISCLLISIFSYPQEIPVQSASAFSEWQRDEDECHSGSNPRRQTSTAQDAKVGLTVWQMSQFQRWIFWKNSSVLAVFVPINLSIKLGFFSVSSSRDTYFVDALCRITGTNYRYLIGF